MYARSAEEQRHTAVRALAEQLYRDRHTYLLRIALKNAASEADAEEAVNDAFASFIRAFDPDSEAPPLAWLTLTLKRECWGKRRRRSLDRSADYEAVPDAGEAGCYISSIPSRATDVEQRIVDFDEAHLRLAALKPAERRAIGLIAAGYSYLEVGEITGWTYTKATAAPARAAQSCEQSGEGAKSSSQGLREVWTSAFCTGYERGVSLVLSV